MIGVLSIDLAGQCDTAVFARAGDHVDSLPDGDELLERFQIARDLQATLQGEGTFVLVLS